MSTFTRVAFALSSTLALALITGLVVRELLPAPTPCPSLTCPDVVVNPPSVHVAPPVVNVAPAKVQVAAAAPAPKPAPKKRDRLVVHEWGTFNHMDGAPGFQVAGLQHEEELLPDFVYSRTRAEESPWAAYGDESFHVRAHGVRGKMETPVVYFYSDVEQRVTLDVGFEKGLMSEWYPEARAEPPLVAGAAIDLETLQRSRLVWEVDVLPVGTEVPLQEVEHDEPWQLARRPKSSPVRTKSGETESYLFYRGLGNHELPINIGSAVDDCFSFRGDAPFAMGVQVMGDRARFQEATHNRVRYGAWQKKDVAVEGMRALITRHLEARGLFHDEATAMVDTWTRTWFSMDGNRLLYLLDDATTERILPMSVTPAPTDLVRVLVGRLEYLTPSDERDITQALARGDKETLAKRGRFLEPILRSVPVWRVSDDVKAAAQRYLGELR